MSTVALTRYCFRCDVELCGVEAFFEVDTLREARQEAAAVGWVYDRESQLDYCPKHPEASEVPW